MKKLNSTDIAKLAGVSRSTVSRVVNGYSNVPEETREKVMKVIEENSYYPMLSGQLLSGKKTRTIGLFWIHHTKDENGENYKNDYSIASDSLSSSYFMYVVEAASKHGYLVLSCIVNNLTDKENTDWIKSIFMQERVDAGIFIGVKNNEPILDELTELGKVIGVFDQLPDKPLEPGRVVVNFETNTGEKCIDYLYDNGHRKIAVIDGDMRKYASLKRHQSYLNGLLKHNLEIRNRWMCYGGITFESGYKAALKLLQNCNGSYPTAICANNDGVALGTYKAINDFDKSLLDKISIIGIDGHPSGRLTNPTLATFAFNFKDFFISLVDRTIAVLEGDEGVEHNEFIESQFIEGTSCFTID